MSYNHSQHHSLYIVLILTTYLFNIIAYDLDKCETDNSSCNDNIESAHNQFIQQEFARQSNDFYKASKKHISDNLTPLINAANITSNDIILDLASGPGIISNMIAKNKNPQKIYGIDITKEMIEIARKQAFDNGINNNTLEYIEGNVEQLPFNDNMFDIVITRWTFHHFIKLNTVLKEVNRVLKPNGKLVFLEFCAPNITHKNGDDNNNELIDVFNAIHTIRDPSHVWAFNENGWITQINNGGFEMENIQIVNRLQLPMNWNDFIAWTNPDESSKRARKSMNVIASFFTKCNCDVGMHFYFNQDNELFFISQYIIVVANKS